MTATSQSLGPCMARRPCLCPTAQATSLRPHALSSRLPAGDRQPVEQTVPFRAGEHLTPVPWATSPHAEGRARLPGDLTGDGPGVRCTNRPAFGTNSCPWPSGSEPPDGT